MIKRLIVFGMVLFLLFPFSVQAGPPLDATKDGVNKVLDVLRDKTLKKVVKKARLEAIYVGMFDEEELSRLSLGRNWIKMNASQQKEFIELFRQILEKAYIDKILSYTNEKIEFYKERMLSADRAEVPTKVITSSKEIPITYRLIQKGGSWQIYDVVVENVSLVQNYRSQFNSILVKNTPSQLIEILRKKVSKSE